MCATCSDGSGGSEQAGTGLFIIVLADFLDISEHMKDKSKAIK